MIENKEWIYCSFEYRFLKEQKVSGVEYENFEQFWGGFISKTKQYIIVDNDDDAIKFKTKIKK